MLDEVSGQLGAEPADSDAAVILARALAQARIAPPGKQATILSESLSLADKARRFAIANESPLPENWPTIRTIAAFPGIPAT